MHWVFSGIFFFSCVNRLPHKKNVVVDRKCFTHGGRLVLPISDSLFFFFCHHPRFQTQAGPGCVAEVFFLRDAAPSRRNRNCFLSGVSWLIGGSDKFLEWLSNVEEPRSPPLRLLPSIWKRFFSAQQIHFFFPDGYATITTIPIG